MYHIWCFPPVFKSWAMWGTSGHRHTNCRLKHLSAKYHNFILTCQERKQSKQASEKKAAIHTKASSRADPSSAVRLDTLLWSGAVNHRYNKGTLGAKFSSSRIDERRWDRYRQDRWQVLSWDSDEDGKRPWRTTQTSFKPQDFRRH